MLRRAQSGSLTWAGLVWEGGGERPVTKNREKQTGNILGRGFLVTASQGSGASRAGRGALAGQTLLPLRRGGAGEESGHRVSGKNSDLAEATSLIWETRLWGPGGRCRTLPDHTQPALEGACL